MHDPRTGPIPALITPFRDGAVDEAAFRKLVAWQIEQGSHGLVPCGTNRANPRPYSHDEHKRARWSRKLPVACR